MQTTNRDKIIVHLLEHHCTQEYPATYQATQHGIADNTGMLRSHVPRTIKRLILKKLVEEKTEHVKGMERKRKVYKLTAEGLFHAKDIQEKIMNMKIKFRNKNSVVKEMKICDVLKKLKKTNISILDIAIHTKDGIVDYKELAGKGKPVDFTENALRPIHFYGREKETHEIKEYLKENRKIIAVYGIPGIGKTALLSKIIEEYKDEKNIFYYNIHEWDTLRSILETLSDFLQKMGKRKIKYYLKSKPGITMIADVRILMEEELKNIKNTIIIFDDTQKANKEIINLLEYLREILPKTHTNLIVAGRKKLGFYDARHILHKTIGEIKLKGLDRESSRKLVDEKTKLKGLDKNISEKLAGKKIADEDFEKIYSITKGHPMALELISTEKGIDKEKDVMKYLYDEVFSSLTPLEKDLMFFVSVFNKPVQVDTLLQNNFAYENVQELIKKNLLLESRQEMVHPHDLLRNFFYHKSSAELRIKNHRKAAEYYENGKEDMDIITAMHHYLCGDKHEKAVRIAVQNGEKLINKGMWKEFIEVTKDIDENIITQKSDWVEILLFKGDAYRGVGEFDKSLECNKKALALSKEEGNKKQAAKAYRNNGIIQLNQADYKKAIENLRKTVKISKDIKDIHMLSDAYSWIGKVYWVSGKLNTAVNMFSESLKYAQKIDDKLLMANTTLDIGFIHGLEGKYEKGIELQMKALKTLEKTGNKHRVAIAYNNIGVTYNAIGNFKKAIEWYEKCIKIIKRTGDILSKAYGLSNLSEDYAKLNRDKDKAKEYTDKALNIFSRLGEKRMIVQCHINYGIIYHRKREWDKATKHFEASIKISKKIESTDFLSQAFFLYAEMLKSKGDKVKAKTHYSNSLKYYEKLGNKEKIEEIRKDISFL